MPLMMGMGLLFGAPFTSSMPISRIRHLIYGLITRLAYIWYTHR